jgi:hypothetical protein
VFFSKYLADWLVDGLGKWGTFLPYFYSPFLTLVPIPLDAV